MRVPGCINIKLEKPFNMFAAAYLLGSASIDDQSATDSKTPLLLFVLFTLLIKFLTLYMATQFDNKHRTMY